MNEDAMERCNLPAIKKQIDVFLKARVADILVILEACSSVPMLEFKHFTAVQLKFRAVSVNFPVEISLSSLLEHSSSHKHHYIQLPTRNDFGIRRFAALKTIADNLTEHIIIVHPPANPPLIQPIELLIMCCQE
uniref:NR LBD domain-containing protein n=1 Tax=Ascaris lumbricoides TaxID=6252 RepID=A0A0M3HZM9_ASCLU